MVWVPKSDKDVKARAQTSTMSAAKIKNLKVTFKQLLVKYEKKAAKDVSRVNHSKHYPRSLCKQARIL